MFGESVGQLPPLPPGSNMVKAWKVLISSESRNFDKESRVIKIKQNLILMISLELPSNCIIHE